MKRTVMILLMMLSLSNSTVYADWGSVNPPYVSPLWTFTNVHFTSSDEGWAVGTDGKNRRGGTAAIFFSLKMGRPSSSLKASIATLSI